MPARTFRSQCFGRLLAVGAPTLGDGQAQAYFAVPADYTAASNFSISRVR